MPLWRFRGCMGGFYGETVERWWKVDRFPPARSAASLEAYLGLESPELIPIEVGMWPLFEPKVLEEQGDKELVRLASGQTVLQVKNKAHLCSMPQFLDAPVRTRTDWEAIRERYQPGDHRYPLDWEYLVDRCRTGHKATRLGAGAGYVPGYYGHLRALLGIERLSLMYYDDPQLLKEINEFTVSFLVETLDSSSQYEAGGRRSVRFGPKSWQDTPKSARFGLSSAGLFGHEVHIENCWTLDRCFSQVTIDMVVIGEDMAGRNGLLISPAMFREFMMPYYKRFTAFCRALQVGSIWVDSDGDIRQLIPLLVEAGIDGVLPLDNVMGVVNPLEIREAFPTLLMAGGIDKRVVEEGRSFEEIDAELDHKVRPLILTGGYFPGPDHAWTPQASLRNILHYVAKMREVCDSA